MVFQGKVTHGHIVLDGEPQLPEGAVVRVELLEPRDNGSPDSIYQLGDFAVATGISDLALNIDHYLYGHPKVSDEFR